MERERLLGSKLSRRCVADVERHDGEPVQCLSTSRGRTLIGAQGDFESTLSFRQVALQIPEAPHGTSQAKGHLALARGFESIQGGSKVVVLALQPIHPFPRISKQVRLGLLGKAEEVLRVA